MRTQWKKALTPLTAAVLAVAVAGCATQETHREVTPQQTASVNTQYQGEKSVLVVGKFQNRSNYMQGIFSSGDDMLGNQAKTILKTHLQQTNRFAVVDRENMDEMRREAEFNAQTQEIVGARYVVAGDVTEFGRKTVGDRQLFGILGSGKKQLAYAKVSLTISDTKTSAIVYSTQGAGEYELSNREVLGFGSTAAYDATLNGKVLNFAIIEAVNNIVEDLESGAWQIE
ncbi:MAG: CsgG/HfaB family protein [Gammaproteobacteria bacterium]|nr:CsgG/HfaB family protein [Gammaproteobacteria bacterium]